MPKSLGLTVTAATAGAYGSVSDLIQYIERQTPVVYVKAVQSAGKPVVGGRFNAMGSIVKAFAGGGVEDHAPQIASTRPGTVRVWAEPETQGEAYIPLANKLRRARAQAIAAKTVSMLGGHASFATGGINHTKLGYEFAGIFYSTLRSAVNAQTRARQEVGEGGGDPSQRDVLRVPRRRQGNRQLRHAGHPGSCGGDEEALQRDG